MLTIKDVAEMLNISQTTIRRLVALKRIKSYKVGGQIRFNKEDVYSYPKSNVN